MPRLLLLLLLLVAYLTVRSAASPAVRRIYLGLDQDESGFVAGSLNKPLSGEHHHHRSRRFMFPGSASPRSGTPIFFPGAHPPPSPADNNPAPPAATADNPAAGGTRTSGVTKVGSLLFPGDTHDVPALDGDSACGVGADLKYEYEGRTWRLLSRDQCYKGEWAVMVSECQPGCRPLPCPPGQLEHEGQCVNVNDTSVCGGDQVLYLEQTGSTFCDCENDHLYYQWDGHCYVRQERGPCDFGYFLDLNKQGAVECMPNPCQVDTYAPHPDTGKCLQKDFVGYCPEDRLQPLDNQTIDCFLFDIRNIFGRSVMPSCPAGSGRSHRGDCQSEFVVPTVTTTARSLTSGCYGSAISSRGGPCRSVNDYFL